MRLTGDYRIGEKTAQPTLLEERECFGAEYAYRSCQLAWRHRPKAKAWQNLTDWTRLANTEAVHHADEPGVRVGHELLKLGLPAELREIQSVWAEEGWGKLSPNQFQAFLNTPPQRCVGGSADRPQLQVLGKGLWGAFLQRQLCHTMKADHHFLHRIYASPDEASAYRSQANKLASQLLLYPFLLRQMAPTEDLYRQAQEGSMKVIRSNPQSVPAGVWNWVCYETDFCPIYVPGGPAWVNEWHRYNPPSGTAYDVHPRMNHPSLTGRKDFVEQMRTWQAQAPHNRILYTHLMRILREKGTPLSKPEMLQILGPVMEYDADAVFRLATETATTPTEYLEYLERAARLNPRYSLKLLEAYRDQNNPGEHEAAFVRWIDTDPDPVQVANVAHEMIEYWEQSGQKTKATQLAERAAQAGSLSGLCAKGHLLERRGQPEQALPYYQEVYRRYENAGPMLGCLKRMAVKNPVYQDKFRQAVEQSLNALTPFQKPSDSAPPQRGVTPRDPEVGGLESSDIIVAVRGYQVTNQDHYVALRDMQVFEPFSLVVYRRGQYLELGPYPYEHRVGPLKALSE
jgi:tetratricopeptide (TPR) repeat protein